MVGMTQASPMVHDKSKDTGVSERRHYTEMRYDTMHMDMHGNYPPSMPSKVMHFMAFTSNNQYTRVDFFTKTIIEDILRSLKSCFIKCGTPKCIRMDHDMTLVRHDLAVSTQFQCFCQENDISLKVSAIKTVAKRCC